MPNIKLALSSAKIFRTCPPPAMRKKPDPSGRVDQHIKICPYCSNPIYQNEEWNVMIDQIVKLSPPSQKRQSPTQPIAGELRQIKPDLATWRNGLYYTPPCVLIVDIQNTIGDDLMVAQVYHDIQLAGPGDLILMPEQTGYEDIFVECWNIYTMRARHLGPVLGHVNQDIIDAVKDMRDHPSNLPKWGMITKPLLENDPRIYFRELEIEVGYTFAEISVTQLLKEYEDIGSSLAYDSVGELKTDIRKKVKDVHWPRPIELMGDSDEVSMDIVLATCRFPAETLPYAADETGTERVTGRKIRLNKGRIESIEPIRVYIYQKQRRQNQTVLTGKLEDLTDGMQSAEFICFIHIKGQGLMKVEDFRCDINTGSFYAMVDKRFEDTGAINLAVMYEVSESDT